MIWLTSARVKIHITNMHSAHLKNAIAMMEREIPAHYLDEGRNAVPIYHAMKAELAGRIRPRVIRIGGARGLEYRFLKTDDGRVLQMRGYSADGVLNDWMRSAHNDTAVAEMADPGDGFRAIVELMLDPDEAY